MHYILKIHVQILKTRVKLLAKQQMGLTLMSEIKQEVSVRSSKTNNESN